MDTVSTVILPSMSQWDQYNKALLQLYEHPTIFLEPSKNIEAVCEHLCLDSLAISVLQEMPQWASNTPHQKQYAIHPKGIMLVSTLPVEYKEKPYEYFLKKKQDSLDAEANFKLVINQVNTSIIKTSWWTKLLFIATLVMAVGTVILAIYPFFEKSDEQLQIEKLENKLQLLQRRLDQSNPSIHPGSLDQDPTTPLDSSKTAATHK